MHRRSHVVYISQPKLNNISREPPRFSMRFIRHPIGSETIPRTYGGSEQRVHIWSGVLWGSQASHPSWPLQCHVICFTRNGTRSTKIVELRISSFYPLCLKLYSCVVAEHLFILWTVIPWTLRSMDPLLESQERRTACDLYIISDTLREPQYVTGLSPRAQDSGQSRHQCEVFGRHHIFR
jgi:hypothetical protein